MKVLSDNVLHDGVALGVFSATVIRRVKDGLRRKGDMTVGDRLSNGSYGDQNERAFHGFGNDLSDG